jgi:NADPH:quinone reductase-like Zn-dependent oxidoreductase
MMANRVHQFVSPSVISYEDIAVSNPGAGEVLVRVSASGVGPWDGWIRSGKSVLLQPLPLTLGADLSGTIEAVGDAVGNFKVGDEVFGVANPRFTEANAEYAIAAAGMLAMKPRRVGHIEAASIPVVAVTAWQMLFEHGLVAPGRTVLVLGAAGNVGTYAVQLACLVRARVVAVAGAGDADYLKGLDADEVIDYRSGGFEDDLEPVDVVIDTVGGEMQKRSFAVLRPGGVLVSAVSQPDASEAASRGVSAMFILVNVNSTALGKIATMFEAGELEANIGTVLPLAEARTAHEMLEGMRSRPRGKIVLTAGT